MEIVIFLDYLGTGVFAISGALAGMNKKFDPFGVLILAMVTAIGGGTLRDVLIGRTPVGWMMDINYAYVIFVGTLIAMVFRPHLGYFRRTMFLFDAMGLGLFTIIGVEISLAVGLHPIICIILGTMSASFGGVVRDVLSNQVPLIFHKEIYASISIIGGILFLLLYMSAIPDEISYVLTSAFVIIFRILAVKYEWSLPKFYPDRSPKL